MDRYELNKGVGDGTFGSVWQAINKQTGEVVAIKKMKKKYYSWEECINLREVQSLKKMKHPNIIKLKEVIREHDILYFVFEYMECNLYQLMTDRKRPLSEAEVRNWCFQVFQGLAYMHQRGYFHRDLKPENLLVSKDVIKIADLGLAREIDSAPPYTDYVSTRWYRAPEILLRSTTYTSAVDMWAMGAIMAEMLTLRPLFPGISEVDETYKICSVIGTPTESIWPCGLQLARAMKYQFPQLRGVSLSTLMPSASEDVIHLIRSLCSWDPLRRPSAAEVLQHPFFQSCFYVPPSLRTRVAVGRTPPSTKFNGYTELKPERRYPGPKSFPDPNPKPYVPYCAAGVQRKLEMDGENLTKYINSIKSFAGAKQPKFQPSFRNSQSTVYPGRTTQEATETAKKLTNMNLNNSWHAAKQSVHAPMKAGGRNGQYDMFMERSQVIQPTSNFARKVAG